MNVVTVLIDVWRALFDSKKIKATICGHKTKAIDTLEAFGRRKEFRLPLKDGKTSYCHSCLSKMAIRCAVCGGAIHMGDMVAIGSAVHGQDMFAEYSIVHEGGRVYTVCFSSQRCVDATDGAATGIWVAPGKIRHMIDWHE